MDIFICNGADYAMKVPLGDVVSQINSVAELKLRYFAKILVEGVFSLRVVILLAEEHYVDWEENLLLGI